MLPIRTRSTAVFALFSFFLPLISLLASQGVVLLLVLAAVGILMLEGRRLNLPALLKGRVPLLLALLLAWLALAALWSFDPGDGLILVLRLAALAGAGILLHASVVSTAEEDRDLIAKCLAAGFFLALAIVAEELLFGFPLFDLLKGPEDTLYHQISRLNRGASALTMLAWPLAAYLWTRWSWIIGLLPLAGIAVLLPFLESSAAQLGLVLGLFGASLVALHRQSGRVLVAGVLVFGMAASPFLAQGLFQAESSHFSWLPASAKDRVAIWQFSSERIFERPVFGWGFDSSRDIANHFETSPPEEFQGQEDLGNRRAVMRLHPHNASLQVLLETGFVGLALAAALLWFVTGPLRRPPSIGTSMSVGFFMATFGIAATAYGIWQNQWIALIISGTLLMSLFGSPARSIEDRS